MKKFLNIFLFCLLLNGASVLAQDAVTDSLLNVLATTKEDTTKVKTLNALFQQVEFSDDAKSKEYLSKAKTLAEKIGFKRGLARTYALSGFFEEDKGNFSEALNYYILSLKTSEEAGDKAGMGAAYDYIGIAHYNLGNYSEALKNNFAALKIRQELNDTKGVSASYNNIGNVYLYLGNYPEALKNHLASLKNAETRKDKNGQAYAHWGVGSIYYKMKNFPEAIKNYEASLKLATELGNKTAVASTYNNLANVYSDQGIFPVALKYYEMALGIYESIGNKGGVALSYGNIGTVHASKGHRAADPAERASEYESALKSFFASLEIEESIGHKAEMTSTSKNIADVYLQQKKYDKAKEYLTKAETLGKQMGSWEYLKDVYAVMTQLDSSTGNFKGAYEHNKLFITYRDSLDNEESRKKTIQSQMGYDFEKKEAIAAIEHKKELENQQILSEEKSRKQKIVLMLVSAFLVLVLFFAGFIFRSLRTTRKQKDIIEDQKKIVEVQKKEVEMQKQIVEEHQKAIIDSITYARRIQTSLLPTDKYIEKNMIRLRKN